MFAEAVLGIAVGNCSLFGAIGFLRFLVLSLHSPESIVY